VDRFVSFTDAQQFLDARNVLYSKQPEFFVEIVALALDLMTSKISMKQSRHATVFLEARF
jgi:hypothetical protein